MRTLIISLTVLVSSLFIFSSVASAANVFGACSGTADTTETCHNVNSDTASHTDPVISILKTVISLMSFIIGITAIIVLIVAGFQMVVGGSDPQTITNARNTMIYALVGVAIAVLAESIVVFVLDKIS